MNKPNPIAPTRSRTGLARAGRIALQATALAALWYAVDCVVHAVHLPIPAGVIGLAVLLVLLFCGGVTPAWVKDGANWLLSDMLLFFVPAAVAAVQYGGLFREDGWRLALVVVAGTAFVMVAVAVSVDLAARLERRLAVERVRIDRRRVRA